VLCLYESSCCDGADVGFWVWGIERGGCLLGVVSCLGLWGFRALWRNEFWFERVGYR